jgi:choline monooxygenase
MRSKPFRPHVNPQLESAETLASRFYTDPAMLALEKERIFRRTWQLGTLRSIDLRDGALRCATWEQFIVVNFDREARPLTEFLGDIPQQASEFRFEGLALTERRDYVVNCNWKIYVDNYLDAYHIPIVHPGLMKEIDYPRYRTETFRYSSQQLGPLRDCKPNDMAERVYPRGIGLNRALYF